MITQAMSLWKVDSETDSQLCKPRSSISLSFYEEIYFLLLTLPKWENRSFVFIGFGFLGFHFFPKKNESLIVGWNENPSVLFVSFLLLISNSGPSASLGHLSKPVQNLTTSHHLHCWHSATGHPLFSLGCCNIPPSYHSPSNTTTSVHWQTVIKKAVRLYHLPPWNWRPTHHHIKKLESLQQLCTCLTASVYTQLSNWYHSLLLVLH